MPQTDLWSEEIVDGAPAAPHLGPDILPGRGSMKKTWLEYQKFVKSEGPTVGCRGCGQESGRHHNTSCAMRQSDWHAQQLQLSEETAEQVARRTLVSHPAETGDYFPRIGRHESRKRAREELDAREERMEAETGISRGSKRSASSQLVPPGEGEMVLDALNAIVKSGPPFFDTNTGELLDPDLVAKGMELERQSMKRFGALLPRTTDDYQRALAEDPNTVLADAGWVIVKKSATRVKCRLVAGEWVRASWKDVYQPTPSRGGRRILLSLAEKFDLDAVFGDVRTAFLHVPKGSGPRLFMRPPRTEGAAEDVLWESGQMVYGFQESTERGASS